MSGRLLFRLFLLVASSSAIQLCGQEFTPGSYQTPDGALLLAPNQDYVEPYFATKALIAAEDSGLDVRRAGLRWVAWALKRQRDDGRLERYCRKPGSDWR